jgi:hypothetical protein
LTGEQRKTIVVGDTYIRRFVHDHELKLQRGEAIEGIRSDFATRPLVHLMVRQDGPRVREDSYERRQSRSPTMFQCRRQATDQAAKVRWWQIWQCWRFRS